MMESCQAQPFAEQREVSREPFLPLFILFIENAAKNERRGREEGGMFAWFGLC